MRMGVVGVLSCVAPWAVAGSIASAQLVLTSDQRAIMAEAVNSGLSSFPFPAYSAFDKQVSRDLPSGGGNGKAIAQQTSTVSVSAMSATGSSSAEALAGPGNCVLAQATSDFRITFKVLTPVQYEFGGSVTGAQFRLAEPISGAVHLVQAAAGVTVPYAFTGILKPGRNYTVLTQSSQLANACNSATFAQSGTFSLTGAFTSLPNCPGDLNFDRVVDDADFSLFVPAYDALVCPNQPLPCDADLNGDGVVDDIDFSLFAPAYNALVCPE